MIVAPFNCVPDDLRIDRRPPGACNCTTLAGTPTATVRTDGPLPRRRPSLRSLHDSRGMVLTLRPPIRWVLGLGALVAASCVTGATSVGSPDNHTTHAAYALWSPQRISETLLQWAQEYPDLVRVTTAQEAYGLPRSGGPSDCPFDGTEEGCLHYILTIQDYRKHPEHAPSSARLPEVLWSGEVHGNERVGPTAVMEAAQLLLEAATCESLPQHPNDRPQALACRQQWKQRDYLDSDRKWLARLVSTRRIVVVPTANALGYYRNEREEGHIDPNRDFPYDLRNPRLCMQTIAARTLNEVAREHMFQLALTFHGGMEVIGYEWGAPTYTNPSTSPDDTAQAAIAAAYSRYGGGFAQSQPYSYGNMNDLVYPVRGGMEDWAYAGSWDTERVIQCEPTTYGGYPKEKTVYGPSTLRVFNMLVESSDQKTPPPETLGTSEKLFWHGPSDGTIGNGYVSRNIRLSLLAAEFVQPYAAFTLVNELELSDDVVPLVREDARSCQRSKAVQVPHNSRQVVLQWRVGGALTIDQTRLWYAKWTDIPATLLDCVFQPNFDEIQHYFREGKLLSDAHGTTRFSSEGGAGKPFVGSIDISEGFQPNDEIVVVAIARVDQDWGRWSEQANPAFPPQSHIVNARTNVSWYHESAGKIIQGRLDWFSSPLTIVLSPDQQGDSSIPVATIELSSRFGDGFARRPHRSTGYTKDFFAWILVVATLSCALFVGGRILRQRIRRSRRDRIREEIVYPSILSPGFPAQASQQSVGSHHGNESHSEGGGDLELREYNII